MKISSAKFVTSVADSNLIMNDTLPQVAFVGRSNVGKSSLINMLVGQKKLAKTSSMAGRTRLINYFKVNEAFYFVDLPGYGFAKASAREIEGWQGLIEPYLVDNERLKVVCMLVDVRHEPTDLDKQMFKFLNYYNIPTLIIATKSDKLSKAQLSRAKLVVANGLGVGTSNVVCTSSEDGYNKEEVLSRIEKMLEEGENGQQKVD